VVEQTGSTQIPAIAIIQRKHFTGAPQVEEKLRLQSGCRQVKRHSLEPWDGALTFRRILIGRQLWPKLLLSGDITSVRFSFAFFGVNERYGDVSSKRPKAGVIPITFSICKPRIPTPRNCCFQAKAVPLP
jgi:hypothetical protein